MAALRGDEPFIMMTDGRGAIFSPSGLKDGPLPTHYEPVESAVHNPLHRQQSNPVAKKWRRPGNPLHEVADPRYPRSEEHTSELQSLMRISYAVFCLKKKKHPHTRPVHSTTIKADH